MTLTSGFLKHKYNRLLAASLLGWVVALVGEMADSVFAGLYLGEDAVSGVSLVSPVFSILFFVCCFVAVGSSTIYSRVAGTFDREKSYKICGMSLLVSAVMALILTACIWYGEDAFFRFYDTSIQIETYAREYYRYFPLQSLIYPVYWTLYYLVTADGDASMVLCTDISTAVSNAVLSWFLVQRMGTRGLALSTALSLVVSSVFILAHFLKKTNSLHFRFYFSAKDLWEIVKVGSTCSLTTLYVAIIDIVMNKYIILSIGEKFLAAYAVVNLILNFACCFSCASDAAGPFMAVFYGENNPVGLKRILGICTNATLIVSSVFVIGMELVAGSLPSIYGITDPEVFDAAVYSGRVLAVSYFVTGFVYEGIAYFPRVNKVFIGNALGIIYMLLAPVAFVFPLAELSGYRGLVWGFFLTPFAAMLFYIVYSCKKYGRKKLPFLLPDTEDRIFNHELKVDTAEIMQLNMLVRDELKECGVPDRNSNLVQLIIEETFTIVAQRNPGKTVLADCTIMVGSDRIRLITRDNGIIFDITDTDAQMHSLGAYVADRIMQTDAENSYLTTISFNRNSYVWNL